MDAQNINKWIISMHVCSACCMLLFLVLAVSLPGLEFYVVTRSYSSRTFLCTLALLPWLVWNNVYLPATHMSAEWLVESRSSFAYLSIWDVDFLLFLLLLPHQLQLKAYEITSNIHRLKLCLCHRSQQLHRAWLVNRTFLWLALFLDTAQLFIACSMEKWERAWYLFSCE